jgi:hypothetical protein
MSARRWDYSSFNKQKKGIKVKKIFNARSRRQFAAAGANHACERQTLTSAAIRGIVLNLPSLKNLKRSAVLLFETGHLPSNTLSAKCVRNGYLMDSFSRVLWHCF